MELANANENGEAAKYENFSIRGYVAEVSKQNDKMCWPFAKVDSFKGLEEPIHELPPLRAAEFRWWGCQKCVRMIVDTAKETGEVTYPSPDGCELIHRSDVDAFTSSHKDAPLRLSGFSQAAKDYISEGRKYEAYADMNVNEDENENLLLAIDRGENKAPIEQSKREVSANSSPHKGHDNAVEDVDQVVLESVCVATIDQPLLTKGDTASLNEITIGFQSNKHQFNIYAPKASASSKSVSDKNALKTVSLNPNGKKRKQKRMGNSVAEMYLDVNPGCRRQGVIKRKKRRRQETSDCVTGMVNVDIDDSNEHENSGVTSHKRKVRMVRTLVDILKNAPSVVCVKDIGMDLNYKRDGPIAIEGSDANVNIGKKRKRKTKQEKYEGSLHKNDEMFSWGKKKSKLPRVEDGRSAFVPWNEQLGFQIGRCDVQSTEPWVFSRGNMPQVGSAGSQFHHPMASSGPQNYMNSDTERNPNVSTCRTSEPTVTEEMEIFPLMARNKYERHLFNAEGTAGNNSDSYYSHASMGFSAFSLPLPNYKSFGTNNPKFVGGSSHFDSVSQPIGQFTHKETEKNYGPQPVGQLDLFSNNTIPATHLLRLMDAGVCTNTSFNAERRKVSELPLLPQEHRLPQLPTWDYSSKASMLPPTWSFDFASQRNSFGRDSGPKRNSSNKLMSDAFKPQKIELMSDVFKCQKKEKGKRKNVPSQSRSVRATKWVSRDDIPTHRPPAMDSAPSVELDVNNTNGTEICTLNRNPADFSLPEAGNKYMIKY